MKKLIFILPLLYYSCTDDIVSDIGSLQTENQNLEAYIDSLNTAQQIADSLNNLAIQAYIDSLINTGNIADDLLQTYIDSLNTIQNLDCNGELFGSAIIDECGVCSGGTTGLGIDYLKDECGVCGGDNSSCKDCLGIANGTATMDNCGICDNYTNNDCVNHIEMELEIMPSSIYKISDWFSGTIHLATLSMQNISNETKEISIYYKGIINGERVIEGQIKPISLIPGEVKIISNVNFDPYSIWWYNNELNFINNLISIGHLLTGNYSIQIFANEFDELYGNESNYHNDSDSRPINSEYWWILTGYTSTDTLYYSDSN